MTEDADSLEHAAEELSGTIRELNESIRVGENLRDELDSLTRRSVANRRMVIMVIAGLILDVSLTIIVALTVIGVTSNSNTINELVRLQHDSALCPMYQLFIDSDTPAGRESARQRGNDMAEREKLFNVIRASYAALNCSAQK